MPKTWTTRRRGDEKDLSRWLSKGKTIYIIETPNYAGNSGLWNHRQMWSAHTCTKRHPLIGNWYFDGDPTKSVSSLFGQGGGIIYDTQPRGIPHVSDLGPRVAGPLREEIYEMSLKEMEYLADEAKDRADADLKAGRRKRTSWF
ncbi:hypothetical protein ACIQV3_22635 [Streptomyces sp. NPDC099050]|uniref:hypothetical protein n=1 Tax=Streptomyces sp. NPDC099050 TaxID=3366100 RepID=UPI0037F8D9F3